LREDIRERLRRDFSNETFMYQLIGSILSQVLIILIIIYVDSSVLLKSIILPQTVIQFLGYVLAAEFLFMFSYLSASFIDAFIKFVMFYIFSRVKSKDVESKKVKS